MKVLGKHLPQKLRMTSSGFTLIELMVTIAVLAIIVGIAAPSISTQLANQRVKSTTATLANALKEARVESVIRRQKIEVSYNNNNDKSGTIKIKEDDNLKSVIANYTYDARSVIKGDDDIEFKPNKTADKETLMICDKNKNAAPMQVQVSKLGNITTELGGKCS